MVKVDELNEYIDRFSTVVEKLDTLADSAAAIERTSKIQENMAEDFEKKWTDAQLSVNSHMDNMENHLSDKLALSEQKMEKNCSQLSSEIASRIKGIEEEISEQGRAFDEKIKSLKTLLYVSIACAAAAAVLVVVMKFI